MEVTIEEYSATLPDHKWQFAELNREWLEKYFYVEPVDVDIFSDPEGSVIEEGGIILFARVAGRVVGTCSLFPLEKGCFEIAKMGVTEAWQGCGIGERLLREIIRRAQEAGAIKLFIVSNTKLEAALRLYRRHGFVVSDEMRHANYARGNITLERSLTGMAPAHQGSLL